ncbi:hypothetical protein FBU30_008820 [Linnemannia zychae]|nr:hypothetical protein FBU30_008820 [Linnemannia zychae]
MSNHQEVDEDEPRTTPSSTVYTPVVTPSSPATFINNNSVTDSLKRVLTAQDTTDTSPKKYFDPPIRLTTVQRASSPTNVDCVTLSTLVGDPDLELMVQINFMIDVPFVMSHVHESIRNNLKTIVYHGLRISKDEVTRLNTEIANTYPRISMNLVPVVGMGTHHTKAMILFYRDGTMQLVIHTANMIERDWRNKTQGVFRTGRLTNKLEATGISSCAFERDLLEYLSRYSRHEKITSKVRQYDFSKIKAILIASTPGKFKGPDKNKWGHLKLRAALRQQVEVPKELLHGAKIICQISSIGSLGVNSQDWLRGEFEASLSSYRNSKTFGSADMCVVYPTAENVRTSFDGWSMGGSLPFRSTSYEKQSKYLNPILYSWQGLKSGRERAMPHIKTYTRVTSRVDGDYLSWFLLTSANLSKPAWGELKADGIFDIKSYELGVLIFPGLYEDCGESDADMHMCMMNSTVNDPYPEPRTTIMDKNDPGTIENNNIIPDGSKQTVGVIPIRLPYDLPLKKYDFSRDNIWLVDKFFPGQDDFGVTLTP